MNLTADNSFSRKLAEHALPLRHTKTEVLQINVGKLCNLTCIHCHVNAGPKRKEIMTRATIDQLIDWLAKTDIPTVDLTGGAPEMIPDFKYLVERLKALTPPRHIIDRCNLTILLEPGYEDYAQFLARHEIEIIASMPCYSPENVNAQRGNGVFDGSIKALQLLNSLGLRPRAAASASSRLQSERRVPARPAGRTRSRLQARAQGTFRDRL